MFEGRNFAQLLPPPEGWVTKELVLLSYSLDLAVLNEVLLQSGLSRSWPLSDLPTHVFCAVQDDRAAGEFYAAPSRDLGLYVYAKGSVRTLSGRGSSFHPKLWAILFQKHGGEELRLRLVIASRNLTAGNMLEGAACLEAAVPQESEAVEENEPLLQLLSSAGLSDQHPVYRALERTDFTPEICRITGDPSASYRFITPESGLLPALMWAAQGAEKVTAISPFLDAGTAVRLLDNCKVYRLYSRCASYTQEADREGLEIYSLGRETEQGEWEEQPLHAKIYAMDRADGCHLFIGSANLSHNGFVRNRELLPWVRTAARLRLAEQLAQWGAEGYSVRCTDPVLPDGDEGAEGRPFPAMELTQEELERLEERILRAQEDTEVSQLLRTVFDGSGEPLDCAINCLMTADEEELQEYRCRYLDYKRAFPLCGEGERSYREELDRIFPHGEEDGT